MQATTDDEKTAALDANDAENMLLDTLDQHGYGTYSGTTYGPDGTWRVSITFHPKGPRSIRERLCALLHRLIAILGPDARDIDSPTTNIVTPPLTETSHERSQLYDPSEQGAENLR